MRPCFLGKLEEEDHMFCFEVSVLSCQDKQEKFDHTRCRLYQEVFLSPVSIS